jgi:hypothetical protein
MCVEALKEIYRNRQRGRLKSEGAEGRALEIQLEQHSGNHLQN